MQSTMDRKQLFGQIRAYAKSRDLDVTWTDVKQRFDEQLSEVSPYYQRRIAVQFETWITRERQNPARSRAAA